MTARPLAAALCAAAALGVAACGDAEPAAPEGLAVGPPGPGEVRRVHARARHRLPRPGDRAGPVKIDGDGAPEKLRAAEQGMRGVPRGHQAAGALRRAAGRSSRRRRWPMRAACASTASDVPDPTFSGRRRGEDPARQGRPGPGRPTSRRPRRPARGKLPGRRARGRRHEVAARRRRGRARPPQRSPPGVATLAGDGDGGAGGRRAAAGAPPPRSSGATSSTARSSTARSATPTPAALAAGASGTITWLRAPGAVVHARARRSTASTARRPRSCSTAGCRPGATSRRAWPTARTCASSSATCARSATTRTTRSTSTTSGTGRRPRPCERFQEDRGLTEDGTLSRGEVVFRPGATRIGEAKAAVGRPGGAGACAGRGLLDGAPRDRRPRRHPPAARAHGRRGDRRASHGARRARPDHRASARWPSSRRRGGRRRRRSRSRSSCAARPRGAAASTRRRSTSASRSSGAAARSPCRSRRCSRARAAATRSSWSRAAGTGWSTSSRACTPTTSSRSTASCARARRVVTAQ